MIALLLASLLVTPGHAEDRQFRSAEEVLANFRDEPDVRQVQEMVLDYSKTSPDYVERWLDAAKNANWLPEFTVDYDYDDDYDRDYEYLATAPDDAILTDSAVNQGYSVGLRAKWRFDKLVMSSERIRVISETQDIVKLRDKILEEATRVYFDRRRLQVEMLMGGGDVKAQLKNELRLQELTAQLDAYTGGRFSESLKK